MPEINNNLNRTAVEERNRLFLFGIVNRTIDPTAIACSIDGRFVDIDVGSKQVDPELAHS
ncbi:MAG: hypothetical protein EOO15_17955 [Chitinophagaceae bacterium]|nr:MAG: hypothetical protein EOO15_17955 [Chitinophagaceae bacterium]